MYRNVVVFAAGALALAVFAPSLFTEWPDASPDPGPSSSPPAADDAQVPQAPPRESGYRQAVLAADARGQYAADTLVNGAPVRMLVDTGASVMLDAAPVRLRNVSLGGRRLLHPDEGRYAEIAREMTVSGDWVTPRLDGIKYFEKPPLQYWLTAATFEDRKSTRLN